MNCRLWSWSRRTGNTSKPTTAIPTVTAEVATIRQPVRELYGSQAAVQFGPRCLKAVRAMMIQRGWSRTHINRQIHRIRAMFRWATSKELIPPHVLEALRSVDSLKKGRTEARETDPVQHVPQSQLQAIWSHVSRQVGALIQLMLLSGARAGELVRLRPIDIDMSGDIWTVRLGQHNTAPLKKGTGTSRGRCLAGARAVGLGSQCPFLTD
jgi:integrase